SNDALAIYQQGTTLANEKKPEEAATCWQSIANLPGASNVPWLRAWLKYHAAQTLSKTNLGTRADSLFDSAVREIGALAPTSAIVWRLNWALASGRRFGWESEGQQTNQALAAAQELGSESLLTARILDFAGTVALATGRLRQAEDHFQLLYKIEENNGVSLNAGLIGLGSVAYLRGDLLGAESYFLRALASLPASGSDLYVG